MRRFLIFLLYLKLYSCDSYVNDLFEEINKETTAYNAIAADIAWKSSVKPIVDLVSTTSNYQLQRIDWQHHVCKKVLRLYRRQMLNVTQERQAYLLCRGPTFTYNEAKNMSHLYKELQTIYSENRICVPNTKNTSKENIKNIENAILNFLSVTHSNFEDGIFYPTKMAVSNTLCLNGQREFEKIMQCSRNRDVLKWVWLSWRGQLHTMREMYEDLVKVENKASVRNGYPDIGASWRDELEIPDVQNFSRRLYKDVEQLYVLLHGVVRFYLRREYGDVVPANGLIPAHLLGSLCAQNWESVADLILPREIDLDDRIKKLNWTVGHMVKRAEDFYLSLGLPAMTDVFWRESIFTDDKDNATIKCDHGAAADMYKDGDVRLLYCSGTTFEDFRILHHEMGHIQYFMAYQHQPGLFRQANTALHESIGDALMHGVMVPQHLHRLRLINDSELYNTQYTLQNDLSEAEEKNTMKEIDYTKEDKWKKDNEFKFVDILGLKKDKHSNTEMDDTIDDMLDRDSDEITFNDVLILKQALNKLPQIPYALVVEEFRWKYFEGSIDKKYLNREFWKMVQEVQGLAPPVDRGEEYFDVGAEYHVPHDTPFLRYFLSSFLQHQIFESLCKAAVFGRRDVEEPIPDSIIPSRCDIYGSKAAGKVLKDLMSRGSSENWQQILNATIGDTRISASALLRYYRPLHKLLTRLVKKYRIPTGW